MEVSEKTLPLQPLSRTKLFRAKHDAAIAQLVEHNLAKVGVAGSSPVFRSNILNINTKRIALYQNAQVAELVDAHVSGACVSQRAGSSPVLGTYV